MENWHKKLIEKYDSYRSWHEDPYHSSKHWAVFFCLCLLLTGVLIKEIDGVYTDYSNPKIAHAAAALIQTSDLSCAGVFVTPYLSTGGKTGSYPVAMRYVNGYRHLYAMGGDAHIFEFTEPASSPCNSSPANLPHPSIIKDWGEIPVNNASGYLPGTAFVTATGLRWDESRGNLIENWSLNYVGDTTGENAVAAATFGTDTLNTAGCWGISGQAQPYIGGNTVVIPNSFVNAHQAILPQGAHLAFGAGGSLAGLTSGASMGPVMIAVNPTPNACAPSTNYPNQTSKTLMRYNINNVGPTCSPGISAIDPAHDFTEGCTPTQAPTTPYPAKIAFTGYSIANYQPEWDPWAGHGWFTAYDAAAFDWYDDGSKAGIVMAFEPTSGWINTTVSATPAPTIDTSGFYPLVTFTIPSTNTHDGGNVQAGDKIWIQTCTFNVDCDSNYATNGRFLSTAKVLSVNTGTGLITANLLDTDFGSGNHKPVVGGRVLLGEIYVHGQPDFSRGTYRLQIYDPQQLAEVAAGTRQPWQVEYNQEMDLTQFISGFGCPTCSSPGAAANQNPVSLIADPVAHQILVVIRNVPTGQYNVADAIYVLNVGTPSPPPIAPTSYTTPYSYQTPAPNYPYPTPATPATGPVTDNFNRADSNSLGPDWTGTSNSGPNIQNTSASRPLGATLYDPYAFWSANSFSTYQYAKGIIR